MLAGQAELIEHQGCSIGPKAAGVEADVKQPIVFEIRLFSGRVKEKTPCRFHPFDADLDFKHASLIEPDGFDVLDQEKRQDVSRTPDPDHSRKRPGLLPPERSG